MSKAKTFVIFIVTPMPLLPIPVYVVIPPELIWAYLFMTAIAMHPHKTSCHCVTITLQWVTVTVASWRHANHDEILQKNSRLWQIRTKRSYQTWRKQGGTQWPQKVGKWQQQSISNGSLRWRDEETHTLLYYWKKKEIKSCKSICFHRIPWHTCRGV